MALGSNPLTEPIVSDLERAARILDCEPGQLVNAVAAAGLEPWGRAASGAAVYRWPELCEAAREHAGIATPRTRPTMHGWRTRPAVQPKKKAQK